MERLQPDPLVVSLDRFEGPLDLLLHLIRKQDIDIFDIPIAKITAQFLEAIRQIERLELERAGEFLEMAATLVRIKVQMLFPRREELEDEDPRADLVRRLLEYEHFREAAELLERSERERSRFHGKGYVEPRNVRSAEVVPLETEWTDVWQAVLQLGDRLALPDPGYRYEAPEVRLEEKLDLVMEAVRTTARVEFRSLVAPWGTRIHAVVSLLASLELAKRGILRLRQSAPFATLWLYRVSEEEADAA